MENDFRTRKIIHWFHLVDADGNGILTYDDLDRVLNRLSYARALAPAGDQASQIRALHEHTWSLLAQAAGVDPTGGAVTLESVLRFFNAIRGTDAERSILTSYADAFFDSVDTDRNGIVDFTEYASFLWAHGVGVLEAVEDAFRRLDADGDAMLSRDELRDAVADYFTGDDENGPGAPLFATLGNA